MKPSLRASLNQLLKMTPQLQQSIKLLQLSTLELQQEIQHQLDINPLLDVVANEEIDGEHEVNLHDEQTDFEWSHLYTIPNRARSFNQSDYPYDSLYCTTVHLKDHLLWQLNLTPMTDKDRAIGIMLIDALDDNGFLTLSLDELYTDLATIMTSASREECEVVRHRLQRFDPIGCCSVNLAETLLVQLQQLPESTPHIVLAQQIIQNDLASLSERNYRKLTKHYQINDNTLSKVLKLIQHLNPKPGGAIQKQSTEFITPDLVVKRNNDEWLVILNPTILPAVGINHVYASMAKNAHQEKAINHTDRSFLRNNLQEARFFLKNIQNRQETLLKVANYIVQFQKDFFESGEQEMKPLILNDVAEALMLHASTISRVTTQKFIHTPRGLFELKYFFSNPISTNHKHSRSSISIRARIKQLIANEDVQKPLSDTKIAELLLEQGIRIARRTIAKYRALMGIAPSYERQSIQH